MSLDSFKQDLLNRIDIVDVINSRVPLKKGGANWLACCPFHSEKTPSFTVSPSKQFYHCFGCGAHGNAIGFLMEYAGLGYIDALRELAESVGMQLPEFRPSGGARTARKGPDLYTYMERAANYYRGQLREAPRAIEYLKSRGLTGHIAARFGIGYAPAGWQNLEAVFEDYRDRALVECGLVVENEQGRRYDRFRDRIVFPIHNQRGAVIGFGGRVVDEGTPKYLNSPETPLFEKGRELYGLTQARQAIRRSNRAIVVEGYMDVVALAQHGVENVVATLGTATSAVHVRKLLQQADEVVFCFDGDAAGRRAAWQALEVAVEALSDRKAVKFLFLPAEHDPDSYVRTHGQTGFEAAVRDAEPLSTFLLAQLCSRTDIDTLEGRARVIAEAEPLLKRVAAPALRLQLLKSLADKVGMATGEVSRLTGIRVPTASLRARPPRATPRPQVDARLERELLRCLLAQPELAPQVPIELLDSAVDVSRCVAALVEMLSRTGGTTPALLLEWARESEHAALIQQLQAELLNDPLAEEDIPVVFADTVVQLEQRQRRARIEELKAKMDARAASREEEREYAELTSRRPALGLASLKSNPI